MRPLGLFYGLLVGRAAFPYQQEALDMIGPNLVNVADHGTFQDAADTLPLHLQPRQDEGLDDLGRRWKAESGPLAALAQGDPPLAPPARPLTSGPSSARPAMDPYRVVQGVFSSTQLW